MTETTEEFGAAPADPFDPNDPSQEEQDAAAGGPDPAPEEHGGEDGTPLPTEFDGDPDGPELDGSTAAEADREPAGDEVKAPSPLKGKRVVLAGAGQWGPFHPLMREPDEGAEATVAMFDGDDRTAKLAALEEYESVADAAKKGTVVLVSVPASSWKPSAPAPRPRKSDWKL